MFTQLKSNSVGLSLSCTEQRGAEVNEDIQPTNVRRALHAYLKSEEVNITKNNSKWVPSLSFWPHLQLKCKIKYKKMQQIFAKQKYKSGKGGKLLSLPMKKYKKSKHSEKNK